MLNWMIWNWTVFDIETVLTLNWIVICNCLNSLKEKYFWQWKCVLMLNWIVLNTTDYLHKMDLICHKTKQTNKILSSISSKERDRSLLTKLSKRHQNLQWCISRRNKEFKRQPTSQKIRWEHNHFPQKSRSNNRERFSKTRHSLQPNHKSLAKTVQIETVYSCCSNKGSSLSYGVDYWVQHETTDKIWGAYQPGFSEFNNEDDLNSPNIHSNNNYHSSSQEFRHTKENLQRIWLDPTCY